MGSVCCANSSNKQDTKKKQKLKPSKGREHRQQQQQQHHQQRQQEQHQQKIEIIDEAPQYYRYEDIGTLNTEKTTNDTQKQQVDHVKTTGSFDDHHDEKSFEKRKSFDLRINNDSINATNDNKPLELSSQKSSVYDSGSVLSYYSTMNSKMNSKVNDNRMNIQSHKDHSVSVFDNQQPSSIMSTTIPESKLFSDIISSSSDSTKNMKSLSKYNDLNKDMSKVSSDSIDYISKENSQKSSTFKMVEKSLKSNKLNDQMTKFIKQQQQKQVQTLPIKTDSLKFVIVDRKKSNSQRLIIDDDSLRLCNVKIKFVTDRDKLKQNSAEKSINVSIKVEKIENFKKN